jgi:hydrogenase maturation protein HypF
MAEYGLDEKVIGISFDGTGYGSDGNIWGGEFMVCDLLNFERIHHLEYIPQPGGDAVTKHPWRMMLAYLHHYFGKNVLQDLPLLFHGLNGEELNLVLFALEKKLNSPLTSSMGRLFDTVSALLGVCRNASYHAEAPMQLEAIADVHEKDSYPFSSGKQISLKPAFEVMIRDLQKGIGLPKISGKFHQTVVEIIIHTAMEVREQTGIQKVALSGGSFQNRILLTKSIHILNKEGFEVFSQSNIPSNDGGIALGQMAIGAKRREMGLI